MERLYKTLYINNYKTSLKHLLQDMYDASLDWASVSHLL